MKNYYGVDTKERRKKLLESRAFRKFADEIIASADSAIIEESPAFKMSDFMLYYENGNRSVFENFYFKRRRNCSNIMMAYWLTEDEKYLAPLVDYITYICDEFTWCLPAHVFTWCFPECMPVCKPIEKDFSKNAIEFTDLFQAETARLFAEIKMCVGDRLPWYVLDRMEYEVRRRILLPLENGQIFAWETSKSNWSAVCGAGTTMAVLYFGTEEEKEKLVSRFTGCLDSYLESILDDGCCQEGVSYWNYGFGHFIMLAEAVKIYTDGKTDYFKKKKVKELALFMQRIRVSDSMVVSFSDAASLLGFNIGMVSFLKKLYSEVALPDLKYGSRRGNVDSISELLWFDENYVSEERTLGTDYFEDTQWYVSKRNKYSFAAKGGYNAEPHNHNDIGSFMITVGEENFISDLGRGEYIKETFLAETRYNFIQNSSRGHSLPIVNGEYQLYGLEHRAKNVKATDNSFELDIEAAYPTGIIDRINRRFVLDDNKVIMTDTFEFSAKTKEIKERIVSKTKPKLADGVVDFGVGKVKYDFEKYDASLITDSFVHHNGVDIVKVYIVDFTAKNNGETVCELTFEIAG